MSPTRILALGAVALVLYLSFYFGLQAAFPRAEVGYDTTRAGRITGTFERNNQRTFFLNGQRAPRYDFDAFAPAPESAGQLPAGTFLSQYLHNGDRIRKPGRTVVLTVQRGDSITQWACAPAAP